MDDSVIEDEPTPLMRTMEENLAGHVSYLQRQLDGMSVEEDDALMVVDSGSPERHLSLDLIDRVCLEGIA